MFVSILISIRGWRSWNFSRNGVKKYFVSVADTPILIVPVSKFIKSLNLFSALLMYSKANLI